MAELDVKTAKDDLANELEQRKDRAEKEKLARMDEADRKVAEAKKQDEVKRKSEEKAKADDAAKKDADLLAKKPEELTDDEKKRVDELIAAKQKSDEAKLSPDEKIKKVQDAAQKRIDEISNEMKQVKDKSSKEFQELQEKLKSLETQNKELSEKLTASIPTADTIKAQVIKSENERIARYVAEDKSLPRNQRREMDKAELEEWMLEDLVSAQEWLIDRRARRDAERSDDIRVIQSKLKTGALRKSQVESLKRAERENPEMFKDGTEQYKLAQEIAESHPEWADEPDAPERVLAEVKKRTAKPEPSESDKKIDELTKKIDELTAHIQSIENSDEGVNSVGRRPRGANITLTDFEKRLEATMREAGASEESIKSAIDRHRKKEVR